MGRPSRLKRAEADILAALSATGKRIFTYPDLRAALSRNRATWGLTRRITFSDFLEFLERKSNIRIHKFVSEKYGQEVTRYSLEEVSAYELALSLRSKSYLSHGTAAELHRLIKPNKKKIYANSEQSPKPAPTGVMAQENIDAAYSRQQPSSGLIYKHNNVDIVALNGKQTKQLGVEPIKGALGEILSVTNLERTLIDLTVRPGYAGGAARVLEAYKATRDRVSVDLLVAILKEIDHRYPFHQAIGFLMSLAGFSDNDCAKLAALGIKYDFYVDYAIKQQGYSKDWRVYYPADMERSDR